MDQIYGQGGELVIDGDNVIKNGITYPKAELADKVCKLLTPETPIEGEFAEKLLSLVDAHVG